MPRIAGKGIGEWVREFPLLQPLIAMQEVFWVNPKLGTQVQANMPSIEDIIDAEQRLQRFAHYIEVAFPETKPSAGIIESPLRPMEQMKATLEQHYRMNIDGTLWLKCDHALPISGSIKARGGIYEVLKHAERLAIEQGLLKTSDDYSVIATDAYRKFFSQYAIAVGSTGNLGLSIGIISAKLGFRVTVHMSSDAKAWKKAMLRSLGVTVIEYASDYSVAVENGRKEAENDPNCHFIDDENSVDLFLGYAVAIRRLQAQLQQQGIVVDRDHPLFLYLPCGVGGGPGGVAYAAKLLLGEHVHCFFAEPTHSPCMLLGLMTGAHDGIAVQDFGIDNITTADGLAVGRASRFVGKAIEGLLDGCYTVDDQQLFTLLYQLHVAEGINLEPSAVAGLYGLYHLFGTKAGANYMRENNLPSKMAQATHIVWATGGSMVPDEEMRAYIEQGRSLLQP